MDNDKGIQGYLYDLERSDFPHLCQDSTDSSDSSESEQENFAVNWREMLLRFKYLFMNIM